MRVDERRKLYEMIKQEIRSLLISSPKTKYGGLSGSLLYADYKELNCGKEIPYGELGFHSFLSLLRSMPDVVRIENKENSSSYRVHPVYDQTTAHIQRMVLEQHDKYQHRNQLYNQCWHSNHTGQTNTFTLSQYQVPFQTDGHFSSATYSNSSLRYSLNHIRSSYSTNLTPPQKLLVLSRPEVLPTPPTPSGWEKINPTSIDEQPHEPLTFNEDRNSCSTPHTFLETPLNFHVDDYRLNESFDSMEKQIHSHDEPVLVTTKGIVSDNSLRSRKDRRNTSSSLSSTSDESILPPKPDENAPLDDASLSDSSPHSEHEQPTSDSWTCRINDAIRRCIHFRYIHRLYEVKFAYRFYPSTSETRSCQTELETVAFNDYAQELEELEKEIQVNGSIDGQMCQQMFNEYVSLQRNDHFMNKLMKKKDNQ